MRQGWIDVQVQIDMDAGEFAGRLNDPWMVGAWQEERVIHLYWPHERWTAETQHLVAELIQTVSQGGSFSVHSVPDEDWNLTWARSVVPFRVGRRMVIRPSWQPAQVHPGDVELILDPKQAFGTGHHATTQLILEWLETHIGGHERILDVGTGSGILAMAAVRLGAKSAWGIDLDPVAIECAVGYAAQNGFGGELKLDTSGLADVPNAWIDVLVANLDRRTLLQLVGDFPRLLRAPGQLVISGVLSENRSEVIDVFSRAGGTLAWEGERDGWLAIHFTFHSESR
jgi:ribosomal protein L11 methyltransferase